MCCTIVLTVCYKLFTYYWITHEMGIKKKPLHFANYSTNENIRNLRSSFMRSLSKLWQLNLPFLSMKICQNLYKIWLAFWEMDIFSALGTGNRHCYRKSTYYAVWHWSQKPNCNADLQYYQVNGQLSICKTIGYSSTDEIQTFNITRNRFHKFKPSFSLRFKSTVTFQPLFSKNWTSKFYLTIPRGEKIYFPYR